MSLLSQPLLGQEEYVINQSRFIQKVNPSFFGFNNLNKVGVLYNTVSVNFDDKLDNKYAYGALSFDDQNFSLGFDINSMELQNTALTLTNARMSFVYKLQIDNEIFFLPSVTLGYSTTSFNLKSLIFEDQINATTGFISPQSDDPLSNQLANVSFPHYGASFLLHSDYFLAGVTLDYLNQPNPSVDKTPNIKLPIRIGVQGGLEMDINPYQRSILPTNSFLFLFGAIKKMGTRLDVVFAQDFQLDTFSIGLNQQATSLEQFSLTAVGVNMGLSLENFDFGFQYAVPMSSPGKTNPPKVFEMYIVFDFSRFRRNNKGIYKRLQTDNYY